MDRNTSLVLAFAILVIGGGIFWAVGGSVERTRLQTEASVARAQEHTRRAEGRHDLVNVIGWARGWKAQREGR